MDGFGDNFVESAAPAAPAAAPAAEVDPAADFLAREQDQLAGLEDDVTPAAPAAPVVEAEAPAAVPAAANLDGGSDEKVDAPAPILAAELQSDSEPKEDLWGSTQPSSTLGEEAEAEPQETSSDNQAESIPASTPAPPVFKVEAEKIRIWREEQKKVLEEKDEAEEKAKLELRERGRKELEDWYKQHEEQVAKTRQANRTAEKELVADIGKIEPGTEWERIAKLCDFNPKTAKSTRDISRMRSIILQVKQNPPVKA
ncbi:clathrin light chain isoform X6 [Oratosquilla oratoria]|uniref:clathrin light chain isoform X6 n=1 Tax=Oratosquilla oratoria TaxID=337810 RepID=UPI003F76DFC8